MELLEREGALATLAEARDAAARGDGRVVLVTGEPGIGKTTLVTRFVRDLGDGARVLIGTCDDLSVPRPLGPIRDLVGGVSPELEESLAAGAAPHEIQALLIAELERTPHPTVLVIEDVHWADDATLDVITVLGRRIGTLPALIVMTFRAGEVPPGHPLHAAVGAIRADHAWFLELAPLSEDAVATLTDDAAEVYAATGGNPFYVTEILCCDTSEETPRSVATAVLGRASRLGPAERRLIDLVSVVPGRIGTTLLDAVMPEWAESAEEPERRQLIETDIRYVRFRHELARNAVRSSIPIAARRRLHAEILAALLAADADPADIVHHAEAAGADDIVVEHVLVAARRAADLQSNREAYSHYRRAAALADRFSAADRAAMNEQLAVAAYMVGRIEDAFPALATAIATYRELGDQAAVGRCTRVLSRSHWHAGDGASARRAALDAITILEPLGETRDLARAYSELSQLAMLEDDAEQTVKWGTLAIDLATRFGDEGTRAHALVNIGTTQVQRDRRAVGGLLEAHDIADAAGEHHEAARALANLAYSLMCWAVPDEARRYGERAIAYGERYEVHVLASYVGAMMAWLRLRAGEWDEAERAIRREIARGVDVVQLLVKTVMTELAIRRGDPDAQQRLDDLMAQADRAAEPQRVAPALELATEFALTSGAPMPIERLEALLGEVGRRGGLTGWGAVRATAWASVAGIDVPDDDSTSPVHAAMLRRDWRAAAAAFKDVGWTYDRALMLSLLDDEDALAEAIEIARGLGAEPLTRRVTTRMRDLGMRVPAGPREATRANPAGLTARQLDVLGLLMEGLTNPEIAERLVVSPKTAEHHVAAVLAKLGATSRRDAASRAVELGVTPRP